MLRKVSVAATTAASLGLLFVLAMAGSAPAITTATTVHLVTDRQHVRERFVDAPPIDRFNPGDADLFRERLLDDDGATVGYDQILCTAHIPTVFQEDTGRFRVSELCEGTITLAEGTIEVSGTLTFIGQERSGSALAAPFSAARRETAAFHIAVTGGTGAYQNVRGEAQPGPDDSVTLHLIP